MPHDILEAALFGKGEMYKARMSKGREDLGPCFFHHPRPSGPRLCTGHWRGFAYLREILTLGPRLIYLFIGEKT